MDGLDLALLGAVNGLAGSNPVADRAVALVSGNYLVKGLVPMLILWGLWFAAGSGPARRARLVATVAVSCAAIAVGRALAALLPHRDRPLHRDDLGVDLPIGVSPDVLDGWTSMPSDHALLYFALATGLFAAHRGLGAVAFVHAALVVCLPRVYLGFHFPSDVLAGAAIGVAVAALLLRPAEWAVARVGLLRLETAGPGVFYPLMFLATFQVASMFDSLRALLGGLSGLI